MYSPGWLKVTVVEALPLYGSAGLPPLLAANLARGSAILISPGPRYLEIVTLTGGGPPVRIGALPPLLYLASSSTHRSSGIGTPTVAVRETAFATVIPGPTNDGPFSTKRSTGGSLNVPSGLSSDDFIGVRLRSEER